MSGEAANTGGDDSLFAEAIQAIDELYAIRDSYFPVNPLDKIFKLQTLSTSALQLLDSIPSENRKLLMQRATYEYLRGKILDALPSYKKEAEDHLSKAVKLNPSLGDAWLSLGNCIWKKGDLNSAKNCLMLALSKGPNKKILCQLSMLERRMAQATEAQEELMEESTKHAREAVALDVKDGYSWYNLGNAFLTSFFMTLGCDHCKLQQALKAYQNAERDDNMKSNPDLYFNSATVNKYLENYERALTGYEAAGLKDPGLSATGEVQKMVQLLDKVESLLKVPVKAKRHASLTSFLNNVELNPSYKMTTVDTLQEGVNKAVAVVGKVLFFIKHECVTPLYYMLWDPSPTCYLLSVYGFSDDAIKEGDHVTLMDPCYRFVNFSWKAKHYQFRSIRIDFLEQVLVNGKSLPAQCSARTSIFALHTPV